MGYSEHVRMMREKVVRKRKDGRGLKILLANFTNTVQQKDIEKRTALAGDYFRVKVNVKAFSEAEMQKKGMHAVDFHNNQEVFRAMNDEFDMPYWAFHSLKKGKLQDYNNTFIYQLKACNIHCPWCYVDDMNKDGSTDNNPGWFGIPKIIDKFVEAREKHKQGKGSCAGLLNNLRPSGGEPTLAIEQWLEVLRELEKRGLGKEVFVQGDTNLTTGNFIDYLELTKQIEPDFLRKVGEFRNFGVLCSFKGTDCKSFSEATNVNSNLHSLQMYSLAKYVKAGIDVYPFIYDSNPKTLERFMETGSNFFGDGFYLKSWLFLLKLYGPEKERLNAKGISSEDYQKKLDERFSQSKEIMQDIIWRKFGLNYQAVPRAGIKLEVE